MDKYELAPNKSYANGLTAEPISKNISIANGLSPIVVDIEVTSGTGTIKIQDSTNGFTTVNTKAKTVAVAGAGTVSITLLPHLSTDQANYPLRNAIRVVADTTSALVIASVRVCHEK